MVDVSWWDAVSRAPLPKIQASVARAIRARHWDAWLARARPKGAARLHTHGGWGSAAALLRCPTELALRVPDNAVRVAVCERLGLPLCTPGRCRVRFASGRFCRHHNRRGVHAHAAQAPLGRAPASATTLWLGSSTTSSPWLGVAWRWGSETRTWAHALASTLWSIPVRRAGLQPTMCRLSPPSARTGLSSRHAPRNRGLLGAVLMSGSSMCSTPRASLAPGWYL